MARWQKGESGNPNGRPKVAAEFRDVCRTHAPQALQAVVDLLDSNEPAVRLKAAQIILDRAYGRPAPEEAEAADMPTPAEVAAALKDAIDAANASFGVALNESEGLGAFTERGVEIRSCGLLPKEMAGR